MICCSVFMAVVVGTFSAVHNPLFVALLDGPIRPTWDNQCCGLKELLLMSGTDGALVGLGPHTESTYKIHESESMPNIRVI